MTTDTRPRRTRRLCALATLACISLPLSGPAAEDQNNMASAQSDDPIELSVFVVSSEKENGYAATNTLSGTRINTLIANTPIAISQLTRDFLNDIGALDGNAAIQYALNAGVDTTDATGNTLAMNPFQYRVRGFGGGTNARNYFRSELLSESYNIDYLEIGRGPNSVLFGIASPGGSYNAAIKKADLKEDFTRARLRFGSFQERRGELDINRHAGKKFALRVNAVRHAADGFYDFEHVKRTAATIAATWRPFANTTIRTELESGYGDENRARPFPVGNRFYSWVASGSVYQNLPADRPVNSTAIYTSTTANGIYFNPQSPIGAQPVTFSGNYFRTSNGNQITGGVSTDAVGILDHSIVPRTANLLGEAGGQNNRYLVGGFSLEQRIGRALAIEFAYYRQDRDFTSRMPMGFNDNDLYIDVSRLVPVFDSTTALQTGTATNPNLGKFVIRGTYTDMELKERQDNYRFTLSYDLNFGKFGHHRLAGLLQRTDFQRDTIGDREVNVSSKRQYASLADSHNAIIRINYIDFGAEGLDYRGMQDPRTHPISGKLLGTPGYEVQSGLAKVSWAAADNIVDSAVAATQSSFFKDKFWITAGLRRDHVTNKTATAVRDATTLEYVGVRYDRPTDLDVWDTTSSTGAVYHVMPWLSVYGNLSDNFNTQSNNTLFAETGSNPIAGNTKGKGKDVGLRSRLFDGRLNFSLGYYNTRQNDQYFYVSGVYSAAANAIWSTLGENRPLLAGNDIQDIKGDGLEFELTANPTANLRLTFNYARTLSFSQVRNYKYVRSYLAANQATWLSAANASKAMSVTTYGSTIQAVWDTIQSQLATDMQTNGLRPFAYRDQSANGFARYEIRKGMLKGLAFGGGVNWRGPMVLAYVNNDSSRKLTGYEQIFFNAMASYDWRISKKLSASVQVNLDNVFNFDDPFPRRLYYLTATNSMSILYQYPTQPRRRSVTTSLRF